MNSNSRARFRLPFLASRLARATIAFIATGGPWVPADAIVQPLGLLFSYGAMRLLGSPPPGTNIPFLLVSVFLLVFFIEGVLEELGWMGYAIDRMQSR